MERTLTLSQQPKIGGPIEYTPNLNFEMSVGLSNLIGSDLPFDLPMRILTKDELVLKNIIETNTYAEEDQEHFDKLEELIGSIEQNPYNEHSQQSAHV